MYAGALLMMIGTPLALGFVLGAGGSGTRRWLVLAARILDEEKMLTEELAGYREYLTRVRYRLVPGVW